MSAAKAADEKALAAVHYYIGRAANLLAAISDYDVTTGGWGNA